MSTPTWDFILSPDPVAYSAGYRRLKLVQNPFPAVGVAFENPGYPPVSTIDGQLRQILREFVTTGESRLIVVVGDYGMGKSHTLRVIQQKLQDPESQLKTKVVYVASAGYEVYALLRNILDSFGRDEITKIIWRLLLDEIRARADQFGHQWLDEQFYEGKPGSSTAQQMPFASDDPATASLRLSPGIKSEAYVDHRSFLREFEKRKFSLKKLREFAIRHLSARLNCSALIAAELFDATDDDALRAQAAWDRLTISGEKGAPFKQDRESDLMDLVLTLTRETGSYRYFVLLVDEFEATVSSRLSQKQQEAYLRSLRLINDDTISTQPPHLVILAVTMSAWDVVSNTYPALAKRAKRIDLPVVDGDVANELIERYLATARPKALDSEVPPLFPFTAEAILAVVESIESKSLRSFIWACRQFIEYLATDEQVEVPALADTALKFLAKQAAE